MPEQRSNELRLDQSTQLPKAPARRRRQWLTAGGMLCLTLLLLAFPSAIPESRASQTRGQAVASEAPRAAREALAVLRQGGTAADAAVVAVLVAGIVNSSSSGIGGGGFVNYWNAGRGRAAILDFREVAPARVVAAEFEARPFPPEQRGKWVGVPGEIAGLFQLHSKEGRLPWEDLVRRAERVARDGFVVGPHMTKMLEYATAHLKRDVGLSALWVPSGTPPEQGTTVRNLPLARTLALVAARGPAGFYEGPVAAEMVNVARSHGSPMTLKDLSSYAPRERVPLRTEWAGNTVYTMPPPSAGGYMLAHTLKLYQPQELRRLGLNSPAYVHALAESFRAALADRMRHFGDPDLVPIPLDNLLDGARMEARRAALDPNVTHQIPEFTSLEHGTHHIVTADATGNVVSITTTVNRGFGAKLMAPKSGVLLNDELDDFTKDAWVKPFGLSSSPNHPRPGARPVSSMTPTLVVRGGKVTLAAGGSGGMTIATNVSQLVVSHLLFGVPADQLVRLPRFEIPLQGGTIKVPTELGTAYVGELEKRGESVVTFDGSFSAVQALSWHGEAISGGADPNKHGLALTE